jgi:condensin complex subunit 2
MISNTPLREPNQEPESIMRSRRRDMFNPQTALDKFTNVVELLHSNKINKSNAFELRIMDYINDVFRGVDGEQLDREYMWQKYSTGIDSCAKIYGYCVDFLHTETYKVLGGLNRSYLQEEQEDVEMGEESDENEERKKSKRKKTKEVGQSTLEKSEDAVNNTKLDSATDFDPYFKQISSCFDASGTTGLLLSNLKVNNRLELMLGAEENCQDGMELDEDYVISTENLLKMTFEEFKNAELCREVYEFETVKLKNQSYQPNIEMILEDMDAEPGFYEEMSDVSLPEEGPEEGLELGDIAQTIMRRNTEFEHFPMNSNTSLIEKLNTIIEKDDYKYFNNPKLGTWAGFEYWNPSRVRKDKVNSEKKPKRKKEPEGFTIDSDIKLEKDKILAPAAKKNLITFKDQDYDLPDDYGFSLSKFTQLFTRPQTLVKFFVKDDHAENVIVDNAMDHSADEDEALWAMAEDIPIQANISNLSFAKSSKTIDIKLLKETIWRDMESLQISDSHDKENQAVHRHKPNLPSFMDVLGKLPNSLPKQEVDNLSVHSCFITLLHLANEHDLQLNQLGDCDFKITSFS